MINLPSDAPETRFTRLLNASPALVFEAWTRREHVQHWWRPGGFSRVECERLDLRVGGQMVVRLEQAGGGVIYSRSEYREISAPQRLVYDEVCDLNGQVFHRARMTIDISAQGSQTLLSIHGRFEWPPAHDMGWTFADMCKHWQQGWEDNIGLLEGYLSGLPQAPDSTFSLTRQFRAPRALVLRMMTEAAHLARWWGPKGFAIKVYRCEPRPGGLFHYSMTTPDGKEMFGRFEYREIVAPERLVFLNAFADAEANIAPMPWNPEWPREVLNTWTFSEADGITTIHLQGVPYQASAHQHELYREMHGSMQQGFGGTLDQLEAYLAEVQG